MNKKIIALILSVLIFTIPVIQALEEIPQEKEREDLGEIITINVDNYQPSVVRSDHLSDVNVPVYAHLTGTTLGSLLLPESSTDVPIFYQIPKIRDISVRQSGQSNKYVASVQYQYPYQKMFLPSDNFIDLGYLVVTLERTKKEKEIPDIIDINLSAIIRFDLDESFGIFGVQDLRLKEFNNEELWKQSSKSLTESSFWNRKGYVRTFNIKNGKASFEVYDASFDTLKILSDLTPGKTTNSIRFRTGKYEESNYLNDRFRIKVEKISVPEEKASVRIEDFNGKIHSRTLTKGMRILEGSSYKVKEIRSRRPTKDGQLIEEIVLHNAQGKMVYLISKFKKDIPSPIPEVALQPFIQAVIDAESGSNPEAVSCTGAAGLMQLVLGTANSMGRLLGYPEIKPYPRTTIQCDQNSDGTPETYSGVWECNKVSPNKCRKDVNLPPEEYDWRFDPVKNKAAASKYLELQFIEFKDARLALLAYNVGPQNVREKCKDPSTNTYDYDICSDSTTFSVLNNVVTFRGPRAYVKQILNQIHYSDSSPIYLNENVQALPQSQEPREDFTFVDPCKDKSTLPENQISTSTSSTDLLCSAVTEFLILIDKYPNSQEKAKAYEKIADIYSIHLRNPLIARDYYLDAYEYAIPVVKDRIQIKIDDLNKIIENSIEPGYAYLEDEYVKITLIEVQKISEDDKPSATLRMDGNVVIKNVNEKILEGTDENGKFALAVIEINPDSIRYRKYYPEKPSIKSEADTLVIGKSMPPIISLDSLGKPIQSIIELLETDTKEEAVITILPGSGKEKSESEFSVHIPIEKRAITFAPEQIDKKIANTKKLIDKLNSVISKLEKTLKIWKATCLITYVVLTIKNSFLNPTKNFARRIVMRGVDNESGWNKFCRDAVSRGEYQESYEKCIDENYNDIESEIKETEQNLIKTEEKIKFIGNIEKPESQSKLSTELGGELTPEQIEILYKNGKLGNEEAKNLIFYKNSGKHSTKYNDQIAQLTKEANSELRIKSKLAEFQGTEEQKRNYEIYLRDTEFIEQDTQDTDSLLTSQEERVRKFIVDQNIRTFRRVNLVHRQSTQAESLPKVESYYTFYKDIEVRNLERVFLDSPRNEEPAVINNQEIFKDNEGNYYLLGRGVNQGECFQSFDYKNPPVIQYNNKGKPYIIPAQLPSLYKNKANYIKIELDEFGNNPLRYEVWNVGTDGLISQVSNTVSDDCYLRGGLYSVVMSPDEQEIVNLVEKAYSEASKGGRAALNRDKNTKIKVLGKDYLVSVANTEINKALDPQCTDVFSREDCHIMYGVCDPVICPTSRFDFGDTWRVDNVVQTGIIGSILLGIKNLAPYEPVPICLTGVLAGLQNIRSILEGYNECLQTVKVKGEYYGICDAVTNIYLCETLWREGISLFRLRGKVVNWISKDILNQNDDGMEYLTFKESLKNIEDSAKFFTKDYAENNFKNFAGKSVNEIGSEICRAAVYSRTPGVGNFIDQVLQPDSPPQFMALLNVFPYAVVPTNPQHQDIQSKSLYEIYYHIFAGYNKAIRYSVYLKDATGSKLYVTEDPKLARVIRASLDKGKYIDKSLTFDAASGFTEVCIEIDGLEKCGFGSVSTAFSMNFLKDEFVKRELSKPITNQKDCEQTNVKLTPSINALQSTQDSKYSIANTGIIRRCGVENPGQGGAAQDWIQIPNSDCGRDEKRGELGYCWLYVNPNIISLDYVGFKTDQQYILNISGIENKIQPASNNLIKSKLDELILELDLFMQIKEFENAIEKGKNLIPRFRNLLEIPVESQLYLDQAQMSIGLIYDQIGQLMYEEIPEPIDDITPSTPISDESIPDILPIKLSVGESKTIGDYRIKLQDIKEDKTNYCYSNFLITYKGKALDCAKNNIFSKSLKVEQDNSATCNDLSISLISCTPSELDISIQDALSEGSIEVTVVDWSKLPKSLLENQLNSKVNDLIGSKTEIKEINYNHNKREVILTVADDLQSDFGEIRTLFNSYNYKLTGIYVEGVKSSVCSAIRKKNIRLTQEECHLAANCFYKSSPKIPIIGGDCIPCSESTGCSDFDDDPFMCTNDICQEKAALNCQYNSNRDWCVAKDTKTIPDTNEPDVNTPVDYDQPQVGLEGGTPQDKKTCIQINSQSIITYDECSSADGPCYIIKNKFWGLKSSCLSCSKVINCAELTDDKTQCLDNCGRTDLNCGFSDKFSKCFSQS